MSQGTNLDLLLSTDYLSLEDEKILEAKTEKEKVSTSEGVGLAIEQEMLLPSILKSFGQENLEPDYDYRIDDETFDDLTKDLRKEYWEEFSMASSKTNAYQIRERLLRSQEADQKLSALGVKGTALRFGAAMLDPLALAADAVTFGIARPFIYANKISRTSKYIRSGLVGAGQAGLITAPVIAADPTRDIEDVGYAMLMGGAITSGLTRFMAPKHPDLRKFDAKSQELGKSMEKNILVNDGHTITPKGEKYFPPEKPVTTSTYIDEVDDLLPPESSIKPTSRNVYSKAETEIVTSIKNNKEVGLIKLEKRQQDIINEIQSIKRQVKEGGSIVETDVNTYLKKLNLELDNIKKQIKSGVPKKEVDIPIPNKEVNIPIPKKVVVGDKIEFFDDAGNKVERQITKISSTGDSVKVKIGKEEKIISLNEGESSFINFKNPNYVLRAAGTGFQRKAISELKKQELQDLRIDLQNKKTKMEVDQKTREGSYKDIIKDLKSVEFSLNVLPSRKIEDVVVNFFDRLDVTPNVGFAKFRGDKSSVLRRSASPFTRSWSEKMAEEAVGNTDSSRSIITSDLIKHNYATTAETLFYKSYAPAFQKFMKEVKNKRFGNDYNINDRMEFSTLVSRAVRGEIIDVPGVEEGVLATRKVLKKILDDLKKDGVQGAKEVLDNPNYFPRRWSVNKMQEMQTKVPYNKLINFLKNSLVRGSKNLSDEDGLRIAKHIYKVVNTNKFGDGFSIDRLLATTDADELRNLIKDYADLNPDELEDLVGALLKPSRGKPTAVPRLRRRASFDENYEETIDGFKVKFTDLLDNNTEGLIGSYIQQMSGQIALARNGIKSVQDYSKIIKQVKDSYEIPEIAKEYTGFLGNARKELELNTIDTIYKNIVGIPTEKNITGAVSTALRNLRKYNYVNVFNQVGFAQIPEMGNIVATAGVRGMIKYIPEFKNIITRAKSGKLSNELLDEIETVVSGTGSNRLIDSTINRTDDFAGATTRVGKVEKTLDIASRITADFSGFHAVDTLSRRLAAITAFDKLAMHATGKYKVTKGVLNRYRNIGFSDDELQAVFKNIRENSTFIEGGLTGRKIRRLNIDNWDDQDLVNKMSLYMSRHLRRVIQENNYGEMLAIGTDSGLGKTMLQFRNFVITAYSKQLLHGFHMRDFTALAGAMSSAFIASLVFVAQTHVQALGKSGSEKEDFLEKRLSIGSIGKAAFQRSTYASLLPVFYDTLASPFGAEPMFNYRTSGLEINLITGNPTYNLLFDKGFGAIKSIGTALADDEYDFSKQSAYKIKAILPYQNMVGITNILQYMIDESDLPSTSK
jgi:hypothetical protein